MLSTIAQGVQSGHATVELFLKYRNKDSDEYALLYDWAENHKTHIALNGGNSISLENITWVFLSKFNDSPWAKFKEDDSLNRITTSISIVLRPEIYVTAELLRLGVIRDCENGFEKIPEKNITDLETQSKIDQFSEFRGFTETDKEIISLLNNSRLAV